MRITGRKGRAVIKDVFIFMQVDRPFKNLSVYPKLEDIPFQIRKTDFVIDWCVHLICS